MTCFFFRTCCGENLPVVVKGGSFEAWKLGSLETSDPSARHERDSHSKYLAIHKSGSCIR